MLKFCRILFLSYFLFLCLLAQEEIDDEEDEEEDPIHNKTINNKKCVYKYQCDENNNSITNTVYGPRSDIGEGPAKGFMEDCPCDKPFTCCTIPSEPKTDKKNDPLPESTQHFHCGEQINIVGPRTGSTQDANLIVASNSEFPWTLAVFKKNPTEPEDLKFICGASLIGQRVAVTANHNIVDGSEYVIRAGSLTLQIDSDSFLEPQDRNVDKIIRHSKYKVFGLLYDIALLIWDTPLDIENNINAICLPDIGENFDDLECKVSGWGASIASTSGEISEDLKFHNLPIVSNDECSKLYRKTKLGKRFKVHKTHICAGGTEGKDTCKGDGGSPLVCLQVEERYYKLVGLVSWGIGCGKPLPGIYVHIANLVSWIRMEMDKNDVKEFISN